MTDPTQDAPPRTRVTAADLDRMTSKLYVTVGADRHDKWSAFWALLVLAAVIASAGIVADSTATVIGAMIVAPLMTPILGTALAVVLTDRRRMLINLGLVVGGALVVIAIGYLLGLTHPTPPAGRDEQPDRRTGQPATDRPGGRPGDGRGGRLRPRPLRPVGHPAGGRHRDLPGAAAGGRRTDPGIGGTE